jgi:hypothetical protein
LPNPVSTTDIEARWRPLSTQETTNASAFLDDAWAYLTDRLPLLEANLAANTVSEDNVIRVVCAMVLRILKNPNGYDSETVDDYTYRRNSLTASGLLVATSDELADLTPGRKRRSSVRLVVYGDT